MKRAFTRRRDRTNYSFSVKKTEKRRTDGYYKLLKCYARSPFRDFESSIRIVNGLDQDDFQMVLKQYTSSFVTCELSPGRYTIRVFSKAVYTMGDHEGTLKIEYNDICMKTKLF